MSEIQPSLEQLVSNTGSSTATAHSATDTQMIIAQTLLPVRGGQTCSCEIYRHTHSVYIAEVVCDGIVMSYKPVEGTRAKWPAAVMRKI